VTKMLASFPKKRVPNLFPQLRNTNLQMFILG